MWNNFGPINISIRLLHMPKACPYKLVDAIWIYNESDAADFRPDSDFVLFS